jgi:hypothetical protein
MSTTNRNRAARIALGMLAGLLAGGLAASASAHQCVEVAIAEAPTHVQAGLPFRIVATVHNCGDPARAFLLEFYIYTANRRHARMGRATIRVRSGHTLREHFSLTVPASVPTGEYYLVVVATAPSGYQDVASVPIHVTGASRE